jgi:hypothetical protein
LCGGYSLVDIVKEQYYLAKRVNISIFESNLLSNFEREAYINMLSKELKEEAESMAKAKNR